MHYLSGQVFQVLRCQSLRFQSLRLQISVVAALLLSGCSSQLFGPLFGQVSRSPNAKNADSVVLTQTFHVQTIPATLPGADTGAGGLIAVDLDGDNRQEVLITRPNFLAAYSLTDGKLWERRANLQLSIKAEHEGVPGLHGPGIQVVDVNDSGVLGVLYVTPENRLEILDGRSGALIHSVELPAVEASFNRWEHAIVANFVGEGDNEILLQASQPTVGREDYIRDSVQAAFVLSELLSAGAEAKPLWQNNGFISLSHGAAKVVDLNQDGKDEVVGATILSAEGEVMYAAEIGNRSFPHLDSIGIGDIVPERPGLEVVVPEEGSGKRVILFDEQGEIWRDRHRSRSDDDDGDKVSVGDFDPTKPGLEMWFRGNTSAHFTVLSARGKRIADYRFSEIQPEAWTEKGFEVINRIRWTGEDKDYIAVKERHEAGDVGIFDALTGELMVQVAANTERLYVADVVGDWREEMIVLESDALKIIENTAPNPNADRSRLWDMPLYRRQKMTWNYYSP
ncbi:MAG: hypothetical protein AB8B99_20145 [Phormidesmis sp.]